MSEEKVLLIGKLINASAIPPKRGHVWLPTLARVPKGKAQEITGKYGSARAAIMRLEASGKIGKGEFLVRARKSKVYIVHVK